MRATVLINLAVTGAFGCDSLAFEAVAAWDDMNVNFSVSSHILFYVGLSFFLIGLKRNFITYVSFVRHDVYVRLAIFQ